MNREPREPRDAASIFIRTCCAYLGDEYRTKLRAAVEALPASKLWWRPNDASNSVGNLLLHLAGNVQQWIVDGVGGAQHVRDRPGEFNAREGDDASTLLANLERVVDDAVRVIQALRAEDLPQRRTIQGRDVTVLEAVLHVTEHFSMHLGQVIYVVKSVAPGSIGFYVEDAAGLAVPRFREAMTRKR